MRTAILFDIDGTLIDSRQSLLSTYEQVCANHDLQSNPDGFRKKLGAHLPKIFAELHPGVNLEMLVSDFRLESFRFEGELEAYFGASELVQESVANATVCGYLTSKDEKRAIRALGHVGLPELPIFSPTSKMRPKPHPDLFRKAREELNFTHGLYIGDTEDDFRGATNQGLDFIFASWGYGVLSQVESATHKATTPRGALFQALSWLQSC